ncbi:DUF4974 domain-containing protein [Fulvivirga sp. M361]|uniref:FecR family protein n=1 Tax=Fulvivirga sp. M361 TaxID=2594266 RepID=UPI00117A917A|nr:FecR family protein [Fulvivirga sp. M361]TRX49346.1 DUF4974 domain-containing protein [Fulvivirga sp. M361]
MEEEIVFRYLNGNSSARENEEIERWLLEDDENVKTFDYWKEVWINSSQEDMPEPDTAIAWQKTKTRINEAGRLTTDAKVFSLYRYFKYAAALLFAVGVIWIMIQKESSLETWQTEDQIAHRILPDGSEVWLHRNSQLKLPTSFSDDSRNVELQGTAFFKVTKNPDKPFIIHNEETEVKVLGTAFMVETNEQKEVVIVESGKVAFYSRQNNEHKVILTAHKQASYNTEARKLSQVQQNDPNRFAWKTRQLVFAETPLHEVMESLEDVYGIHIEQDVASGISGPDCKLTTTIDQEPLEHILETLESLFDIQIEKKLQNRYLLKGEGCAQEN